MYNKKFVKSNNVMTDVEQMIRFLDKDGNLIDKNYMPIISKEEIIKAYKYMVLSRQQDTYMLQLQRQGRMLTFAPNFGEEALQIAAAMALNKNDYFLPAYRANAAMLYLGVSVKSQLLYWNGNEKGARIPDGINVLPINIVIGTQCSHAAGYGYGLKLTGKNNVALTFIGEGGTAEGEFYEAINMAAIYKWPVVFCVNRNQWSISTPFKLECPTQTIASKASAFGIPGLVVDGNDLLASYEVVKEAVEYAREGNGPILIEFYSWRQGPHTTSDNPRIYRTEEQEKEKEKWEPMHRIEKFLMDKKFMTQEEITNLWETSLDFIKQEYESSLKELDVNIDEIFDHTYANLDDDLKEQKEEAKYFYNKFLDQNK